MRAVFPSAPSDALAHVARLIKIVTLVRSRRKGERLGRVALAQACECVPRTITRDLSLLEQAGIPIEYDAGQHSYTLPDQGWVYPVATLTPEDALALALAQSLLQTPGIPQQASLLASLEKTTAGFSPALKRLFTEAAQAILPAALPRDYSAAPLELLLAAANARETVEIDYQSRSSSTRSWRRVDPYAIEARDGQFWELHGFCHRREEIRTFALDQILNLRATGEVFPPRPTEWDAFSQTKGGVGGLRGGPSISVDVLFFPAVSAYARSRRWPDGLVLTGQTDGTVRLTGQAQGVDGLVTELLRWRRHCRVDGGPELRAQVVDELRAMAALYQNGGSQEAPLPQTSPAPPSGSQVPLWE